MSKNNLIIHYLYFLFKQIDRNDGKINFFNVNHLYLIKFINR